MKHGPTWNVGTPCLLFLRLAWFWLNLFWLAFTLLAYMWTDFVDSMLPHFLSTPLFWLNSFWLRSFCSLNLLTHFATPLCRLTLFLRRILRIRHFVLTQFVLTRSLCWLTLLTHFVDSLCWPTLLPLFVDSLCWLTLLTHFATPICWLTLLTHFVDPLCYPYLSTHFVLARFILALVRFPRRTSHELPELCLIAHPRGSMYYCSADHRGLHTKCQWKHVCPCICCTCATNLF